MDRQRLGSRANPDVVSVGNSESNNNSNSAPTSTNTTPPVTPESTHNPHSEKVEYRPEPSRFPADYTPSDAMFVQTGSVKRVHEQEMGEMTFGSPFQDPQTNEQPKMRYNEVPLTNTFSSPFDPVAERKPESEDEPPPPPMEDDEPPPPPTDEPEGLPTWSPELTPMNGNLHSPPAQPTSEEPLISFEVLAQQQQELLLLQQQLLGQTTSP